MSEAHTCCQKISVRGWLGIYVIKCEKPGKYERDGKFYCGIHDPVRVKEREAKIDAKIAAKREVDCRAFRIKSAAPNMVGALRTIAEWPITNPANMDAVNMAKVAKDMLASLPIDDTQGNKP